MDIAAVRAMGVGLRAAIDRLMRVLSEGDRFWPTFAAVVLSVALIVQMASIVLSLRRSAALATLPPSSAHHAPDAPTRPRVDAVRGVLAAHLFGSSAPEQSAQAAAVAAAAQWVLRGVIAAQTPQSGFAMIGQNEQSTRLRAVGQEVAGGYVLAQVLPDRVILDNHGAQLVVRLSTLRRLALASPKGVAVAEAGPPLQPLAEGVWHPKKGLIGVPLPAQAALRPQAHHDSDGQYDGMQVMGIAGRLAPLGLQRDDVITEIDGNPITNNNAAQQALQQISSGTPVMVTVNRGGTVVQLPISMIENGS
jgi:type II secretory pathway component PulC